MSARLYLLLCIVLFISACQQVYEQPSNVPMNPIQQYREVSEFTRVAVTGDLNVNLHTGYAHPQVILRGDPRDLAFIKTEVRNGGLYVALDSSYPLYGKVTIDINGHYLNAFAYHGAGIIKGMRLNTGLMDVNINNQGNTTLQGNVGLRKLTINGSGFTDIIGIHSPYLQIELLGKTSVRLTGMANVADITMDDASKLSLDWIKSRSLVVRGKKEAIIQLAGIVGKLQLELWGNAHFNGGYLRAQEVFVKTHNQSIAEIAPVKLQHTLASDESDIRFYNHPAMETDFMIKQGAVLDFVGPFGPT